MEILKSETASIQYSPEFIPSTNVTAEDFVRTAQTYLGVRYQNQGRTRSGTDCGGLLLLCGRELGITDLEVLSYSNEPDGETFDKLLALSLNEVTPKEDLQAGDIIACDYGQGIQHTAIVVEFHSIKRIEVIHAIRRSGVSQHTLHGRHLRAWVKTYRLKHL